VASVPEDPTPPATPDASSGPGAALGGDAKPADAARQTDAVVGHLTDQARRTANAAKAKRLVNADGEPGVLDVTPLRELLAELVDELRQLRLRDRIARALRQAADIIESRPPDF
jgi:hypothetical protein